MNSNYPPGTVVTVYGRAGWPDLVYTIPATGVPYADLDPLHYPPP